MRNTLRTVRWEGQFILADLMHGRLRMAQHDLAYLCHRLTEAMARDIAWALPRQVALWAFIRVVAAAGDNDGDPANITYKQAADAWTSKDEVRA